VTRSGRRLRGASLPAILAAIAVSTPLTAQSAKGERAEALLRSYHDLRRFNGAALVADGGEVVFRGAFGFARLDTGSGTETPNEPGTRFRIVSLTKQFTAALVMRLVEEGTLRLDASVREYIPEYPAPQGDRVTLHHLLTHTSGIPSHTGLPGVMEERTGSPMTPREILELTWDRPLEFDPGTRFAYDNSGYVLLGWIAERATGRPYDELLRDLVLEPLGLHDTGYDHFADPPEGHAAGYDRTLEGYEPARFIDPSLPFSAGMLYSTVDDLYRWGRALVGRADGPFTDPGSAERIMTPEPEGYRYGLGIGSRTIGREDSVRVVEHTGGILGFASVLRVFPDHDRVIVLLDNTGSDLGPIVEGLTNILWGTEATAPKPSIAERLLPIVRAAGADAAIERYRAFRRTRPDDYDYGPAELSRLASFVRDEGDTTSATLLLEAEVEAYPKAIAARYGLSELYTARGDTARAVAQLEAGLQAAPGQPNLLSALLALGAEPLAALRMPITPVPVETLERLVGQYRVDPSTTLAIALEDGELTATRSGEPTFRLLPQSETTFLIADSTIQLVFQLDGSGLATGVSVLEAGRRATFPRIPPPTRLTIR